MRTLVSPEAVRRQQRAWRRQGLRVGFVPTMGALHDGHLRLVEVAREAGADRVVVSIFVNPTQFGPSEDLAAYPRDHEGDAHKLAARGVDLLFLPERQTIYPPGAETWVTLERLPHRWCGASRPDHFRGVATVVSLLLHITEPDIAVFGEKDYQQLQVIRRMVRDLHMGVEIVGAPTVREPDGLAMSSRNAYLGPEDRARARSLSQALGRAQALVDGGERCAAALLGEMRAICESAGGCVDYLAVVDPDTLEPLAQLDGPARALLAVQVGPARLIDNGPLCPPV